MQLLYGKSCVLASGHVGRLHFGQYVLHQELVGGDGAAGAMEAAGDTGAVGATGAAGTTGAVGVTGAMGAAGACGAVGGTARHIACRVAWYGCH